MRKCMVVGMIVILSILIGCKKEKSDDSLANLEENQKKQEGEISNISGRMDSVERTLAEIQQALEKPIATVGSPAPAVTTEGGVQDFRTTQEYAQILTALAQVQKTHQEIAQERALEELRDPRLAVQAMDNPQEMDRRLNLLVQNFSGTIQDAATRQQFEADVQQLKQNLTTQPTVQQLYERRTAELTARLNEEQDQRRKEFIQRELASLQAATAEELEQRLERYQRTDSMNQLRQLQETYNIPREVLRDSGIATMGGGPGGFQGGGRPGATGGRTGGRVRGGG